MRAWYPIHACPSTPRATTSSTGPAQPAAWSVWCHHLCCPWQPAVPALLAPRPENRGCAEAATAASPDRSAVQGLLEGCHPPWASLRHQGTHYPTDVSASSWAAPRDVGDILAVAGRHAGGYPPPRHHLKPRFSMRLRPPPRSLPVICLSYIGHPPIAGRPTLVVALLPRGRRCLPGPPPRPSASRSPLLSAQHEAAADD